MAICLTWASSAQYSASDRVDHVEPTCRFASSKSHPLIPAPSSDLGAVPVGSTSSSFEPESLADGWQRIEWNDKAALASREVGAVVKFEVEGSTVGVAVVGLPSALHSTARDPTHKRALTLGMLAVGMGRPAARPRARDARARLVLDRR